MGIPVQMKDGRRITDAATLELISGIYAGQVNKTIVAHLQAFGCNAVGINLEPTATPFAQLNVR